MQDLLPQHQHYLQDRGITAKTISCEGIRSLPNEKITHNNLKQMFSFDPGGVESILTMPFNGNGNAHYRIFYEPDKGTYKDGSNKQKFLFQKDKPAKPDILKRASEVIAKTNRPTWFTEGKSKGLALEQRDRCAIVLAGVWNFKAGKDSELENEKNIWQSLQEFKWWGRTVYMGFDADLWTNPGVRYALYELSFKLLSKGAIVKIATWQGAKGIDDCLVKQDNPESALSDIENEAKNLLDFCCQEHTPEIIRALAQTEFNDLKYAQIIKTLSNDLNISPVKLKKAVKLKKEKDKPSGDSVKELYFEKETFIPQFLTQDILKEHKFTYTSKRFYKYDSGYWEPVDFDCIAEIAKSRLSKHSRNNRVAETVSDLKLSVLLKDKKLNEQSEYINLENGMLNWITKKLSPHSPEFYSTVRINAKYNPQAQCPRWRQFLEEVLEEDTILQVQEFIGYCLIQDTRFEKALMLTGHGANGKGTNLGIVIALLGKENVSEIPLQSLGDRFQTAQLEGKLANIFTDLNARAMQDTGYFKAIVSGDRLMVERKHQDPYSFEPFARLIFSCNEVPRSYDRTYAFYRRWIIIPFNKTFAKESADKTLKSKLLTELDGIFIWALEGLHRLFEQQDFSESKTANEMLESYKMDNNNVLQFMKESCVVGDDYKVSKVSFYNAYKEFCNDNSLKYVSTRKFNVELQIHNMNVRETRDNFTKKRAWKGIGLNEK